MVFGTQHKEKHLEEYFDKITSNYLNTADFVASEEQIGFDRGLFFVLLTLIKYTIFFRN